MNAVLISWAAFTPTAGQVSMILLALLLELLDVVSGLVAAYALHEPDSGKMRQGLAHKAGLALILLAAYLVEALGASSSFPVDIPTTEAVAAYITLMELLSITENVGRASPAFRKTRLYHVIRGIRAAVQSEENEEGEDEENKH